VNALFTIALIAVLALWALAVFNRLSRLREEVKLAWKRLDADQGDAAVRTVYNRHVAIYNDALAAFPANIVGPATGFKPARIFEPNPKSGI
jgi:hypothetical protein